jgi:alpha-L-rhamnosidase
MDLIYELLRDEAHPSYGYFIAQDETVWPERWSSVGGSRIHTCYTGIGGYFIMGFGGIRPDPEHPGMRRFLVKPSPVGDLSFANTGFESGYGPIVSNWKRSGEGASFHIEVPVNTRAKVFIPAASKDEVKEGGQRAAEVEGIQYLGTEASDAVGRYQIHEVGSGVYDFEVAKLPATSFPEPLFQGQNLSRIARMSASSMHIETEKIPGFEAFKSNDEDPDTSWKAKQAGEQWLEAAWITPQEFDGVRIDEEGDRITNYRVQAWKDRGWVTLASGEGCGAGREHRFEPVRSTKCRLLLTSTKGAPEIVEFVIHRE